jgi:hypothetical protein
MLNAIDGSVTVLLKGAHSSVWYPGVEWEGVDG